MLHTLRKLAREIHRRSVWQVLGGYLLLWFVAYQLVAFLTVAIGLPLWTPGMAFVLLGIGLPIVLATAVAQGGVPGLRMVDEVDPNLLAGRTPEEVHVIPEEHPLYHSGLFTWRNAVLGGVMAAALLVTSVVAYLTMWAFGIGPVGSLAAQGLLEEGDIVAVADFTAPEGGAGLGARVGTLMEAELARSEFVTVRRLGDASAPEGGATGYGAGADPVETAALIVDGEIRRLEVGGFRIESRIRLPDGTIIGGFGRTVAELEDVGEAVERLSFQIRERFGESLRAIHEDEATDPD